MKQDFIYSLKVSLTSFAGTPVTFVLSVYLLSLLPDYHVPELLGFVVAVYVMPVTVYLSLANSLCLFLILRTTHRFTNGKYRSKIFMTVLVVAVSYIALALNINNDSLMTNEYGIWLCISFALVSVASIWFYKLKPTGGVNSMAKA